MKSTYLLLSMFFMTWMTLVSHAQVSSDANMPPLPKRDVMSQAYWDLWNDDVQKGIDDRIERYRKANATVFLTDVKPGTDVKIEQISHEFLFGASIFNFNQLGAKEIDDKYKAIFGDLLNSATIPFYWSQLEMDRGTVRYETCAEDNPDFWAKSKDPTAERFWRRPATDQIVDFCEGKGIFSHGHTLIWGNRNHGVPKWMKTEPGDVDEMEKLAAARLLSIAQRYGDRIKRWDVVNESATDKLNPHHSKYDPNDPKGNYGVMPRDYTYKAFKYVDEIFPKSAILSINDYDMGFGYINQVADLRIRGCRVDMAGLQMHLFNPKQCADIAQGAKIQHPEHLLNLMNEFGKLGIPLHLSEITITAPNDDPDGREIQANITRNLYRMWFSWPDMAAITWWNLVDGCGLKGEPTTSGICSRQMEKKPAYDALDRLINHEWKTKIVAKAEESRFKHQFRGFKGTYQISWTDVNGNARTAEIDVK